MKAGVTPKGNATERYNLKKKANGKEGGMSQSTTTIRTYVYYVCIIKNIMMIIVTYVFIVKKLKNALNNKKINPMSMQLKKKGALLYIT